MSATERLRKLLDERGMEHEDEFLKSNIPFYDGLELTEWNGGLFSYVEMINQAPDTPSDAPDLTIHDCTPEQAIAATLGSEREMELQKALNKAAGNWARADAELRKALDFMRIWISEDAHLGESAISRELEKAEGLRNLDAIESAIAATLGGGTLTADDVRDLIERHSDGGRKVEG